MAGGIVVSAAAGYQPEGRVVGCAENGLGREFGLHVLAHARDAENSHDPVGEGYIDGVSRAQGPEAEEDSGPLTTVEVTFDDR